jgi:arginyl-tRNA--protein-N-Asp/Glu arginylyltransferase
MKLLFSEATPDYPNYQFPYAVLAVSEAAELAFQFYERGFLRLPGNPARYYLCRSVRVNLSKFRPSSENRRILRKGADLVLEIVPRAEFHLEEVVVRMCLRCALERFGHDVMSEARLREVIHSEQTSHVLQYRRGEHILGLVTSLLEPPHLVHYHFAFHDVDGGVPSLGLYMMTSAVALFAERSIEYAYLGTCYSRRALYKTQFEGIEFFNGMRWSSDLSELKYLIDRTAEHSRPVKHLLECRDYLERFASGALDGLVRDSMLCLDFEKA